MTPQFGHPLKFKPWQLFQLIPTFFFAVSPTITRKSYFFELGGGRAPSYIYVWKTIPTTSVKALKEISVPDSVLVMVETIDEKSSEHDFLLEKVAYLEMVNQDFDLKLDGVSP